MSAARGKWWSKPGLRRERARLLQKQERGAECGFSVRNMGF